MVKTQSVAVTREEKLLEFLKSLELDIDFNYLDLENVESFNDLEDELQNNNLLDVEIIYYSNAIEYLKENDASLCESTDLALEYGYTLENITSEVLASILASDNLRSEFHENETKIEEFFETLNE